MCIALIFVRPVYKQITLVPAILQSALFSVVSINMSEEESDSNGLWCGFLGVTEHAVLKEFQITRNLFFYNLARYKIFKKHRRDLKLSRRRV
jgi:hypothetical protein